MVRACRGSRVAPLRIGGGTRIKIVEAQAHGRPVVATPRGAAGLATGESNGIVLAETAQQFAEACRRLLADGALASRIATAGRARAVKAEHVISQIDELTRSLTRLG